MKATSPREIISVIDLFGIYDEYSVNELVSSLKLLDTEYYNNNNGESSLPDDLYDQVKEHVFRIDPNNPYFKVVGSEARGGKIKLPYTMGSLNQAYIGEIQDWVSKNQLEDELIVIADKLDGTSGMIGYKNELQIGYSRGNGLEGADITRHLRKMPSVPVEVPLVGMIHVRGENIISHENFPLMLSATTQRKKAYSNARNAAAGIMNASENPVHIYNFIEFVAYDIAGSDTFGKVNTLALLAAADFKTPWYCTLLGKQLTDEILTNILNERRAQSEYQIDGLVLDVDNSVTRDRLNKNNTELNPLYSVKYKVADADNIADATCEYVEWNLSKHSYFKPRIRIEPIQLCGVTVTWTQGFNAKFIKDNNIGPGTILKITRTGDVIPHVVGGTKAPHIIKSTVAQMPNEDYVWTDTGVDILLAQSTDAPPNVVIINQLIDFFTKLKVPGLKEGNITTLVEAGYTTPESIIKLPLSEIQAILNSEIIGERVHDGIQKSLINVPFERLMGAYSTSRGIGIRRVSSVYKVFGLEIFELTNPSQLLNIEGIQAKTAEKVMTEIELFKGFVVEIQGYFNFAETPVETDKNTGLLANQQIVITGFRSDNLEKFIESNGGTVQSGVNKKTTLVIAADPKDNSGKIKKAKAAGIDIISYASFKQEYDQ